MSFPEEGRGVLPPVGRSVDKILESMEGSRDADVDWRGGRVGAYVYYADEELLALSKRAYAAFFSENGLSPKAFPSLKRFETEVVQMAGAMLQGNGVAGSMTSCGTESLLLAVKSYRDLGRVAKGITEPEMVMPLTAHPAFNKAAHYFGVKPVRTPLGPDFRPDLAALEAAITDNTVLVVGSAPEYSFGMVDPIPQMARIAGDRGLPLHVDSCLGGFLLPFARKLGYPIPEFDFAVQGVTSISADVHKYGYAAKGASVILYRDEASYRHQRFEFDGWPSGLYSSPTILGTRPGGAIAAAWAVMQFLGEEGYLALGRRTMDTATTLMRGIEAIPGLHVWGKPDAAIFGYGSHNLDIAAVAEGMGRRGWYVNRLADPPGIHLTVTPAHEPVAASYLSDLAATVEQVARGQIAGKESGVSYN